MAVPSGHPLAGRPGVGLAELAGVPFIALRPASALRRLGDELCLAAGFRPDVVFEGDDLSTVRGFVAAGLGVAIVPAPREGSPEAAAGPVRYLEIEGTWAAREIILSWSADRRLLPAAEQFRRHVIGPGRGPGAGPHRGLTGAAGLTSAEAGRLEAVRRRPPRPALSPWWRSGGRAGPGSAG